MPALRLHLDDKHLATVSTTGLDVLSIRVSGARTDEEFVSVDFSGGSYPDGGPATHLIWVDPLPIKPGQIITAEFIAEAQNSHRGLTLEELYPEESAFTDTDFTFKPAMLEALRKQPFTRAGYDLRIETSSGASHAGKTPSQDHGFACSLVWNSFHPERIGVSLHSYSIDDLESKGPLRHMLDERLTVGASMRLECDNVALADAST